MAGGQGQAHLVSQMDFLLLYACAMLAIFVVYKSIKVASSAPRPKEKSR
jgi:hypothetical protein